jgi:hypothetical protein
MPKIIKKSKKETIEINKNTNAITNTIKREFKIYLLICLVLTLIIAVGSAWLYRLTKTDAPELTSLKVIAENETAQFVKNHKHNKDCIDESLKRLKSIEYGDFKSRAIVKLFLRQCLVSTIKSKDICNEVTLQEKNPNIKTARWVANTCINLSDVQNVACANTLEAVESYCGLHRK